MTKLVLNVAVSILLLSSGTNKPIEASRPASDNRSLQETKQLVQANEEIIYAFTTKNKKEVVVVKDTSNNYIKYRYGTRQHIELEFPAENTKESWNKFQYNSYWRGGGKENSGMEIDNLQFTNNGYTYLIYRTYFAENEKQAAGIIITDVKGKETRINGVPKSIKGCICNLEDTGLIEKTDIGLSF